MAKLTSKTRNALPGKDFVFPKSRSYPIEDASHARNALSRVSQNGSEEAKARVRARVHAKYPDIGRAAGGEVEDATTPPPVPSTVLPVAGTDEDKAHRAILTQGLRKALKDR